MAVNDQFRVDSGVPTVPFIPPTTAAQTGLGAISADPQITAASQYPFLSTDTGGYLYPNFGSDAGFGGTLPTPPDAPVLVKSAPDAPPIAAAPGDPSGNGGGPDGGSGSGGGSSGNSGGASDASSGGADNAGSAADANGDSAANGGDANGGADATGADAGSSSGDAGAAGGSSGDAGSAGGDAGSGGGDASGGDSGGGDSGGGDSGGGDSGGGDGGGGYARGGVVHQQGLSPSIPRAGLGSAHGPSGFGTAKPPGYANGGVVVPSALAGPNPAGPDQGYAALRSGEFVVRDPQAQRYAGILQQINQGTFPTNGGQRGSNGQQGYPMTAPTLGLGAGFPPDADQDGDDDSQQGGDNDGDAGSFQGQGGDPNAGAGGSPLMPPQGDAATDPDDVLSRLAQLDPQSKMALAQAMTNPAVGGALMQVLGPQFAGVVLSMEAAGGGMDGVPQGPGAPQAAAPGTPPQMVAMQQPAPMPMGGAAPPGIPMPGQPGQAPPGPQQQQMPPPGGLNNLRA